MYLSLSDRPHGSARSKEDRAARPPVGRVVLTLGMVSLLTDISSESLSAILPLYLTAVAKTIASGLVDTDGLDMDVAWRLIDSAANRTRAAVY